MNTRRFRLRLGQVVVLAALAAGCSSTASPAPPTQAKPSSAPPSLVATASLTPSLKPNPSSAPPSLVATATPTSSIAPPALTQTFTSTMHGIAASFPAGWTVRAATEPWTTVEWSFEDPSVDIIHDPSLADHLFLALGSQPLGATSAVKWIADRLAFVECGTTEQVTVDGASGSICGDGALAMASSRGRGYMIALYTSGDEGWLDSVYDRAWFKDILATVDLRPQDAVDITTSPSP